MCLCDHGGNDNKDLRDTMSCIEISNDVLAFAEKMNFNRVILTFHVVLVALDIAPLPYDATKNVTWNEACKLAHSLNDVIVLNESSNTKKDIDLKLRKVIDDPASRVFVLTNFDNSTIYVEVLNSALGVCS